jgi:hypothetical protein
MIVFFVLLSEIKSDSKNYERIVNSLIYSRVKNNLKYTFLKKIWNLTTMGTYDVEPKSEICFLKKKLKYAPVALNLYSLE